MQIHSLLQVLPKIAAVVGTAFGVISLFLIPIVLLRRKEPSATIAWILTLVFLPVIGAVLFLLFGRDRVRWPAKRKREADALVRGQLAASRSEGSSPELALAVSTLNELEGQIFKVGALLTGARTSTGNLVDVLLDGNDVYQALGEAIDGAEHHISAEYYLIRNDATGAWFRDRLAAAAARGVTVRLLCDGFGCLALPPSFWRPLRRAGVRTAKFLPMRSVLLQPVNLRNHRKIVIVDGLIAFTGGVNIGEEYRGTMRGIGAWRDMHLRITGPAAKALQGIFLQDWHFATGEMFDARPYFPILPSAPGAATVAIVPSGPDTRTEAIHRLIFSAIAAARERVFLTTPYFVPDQAMLVALQTAAMRGVQVELILPRRSNHRVTFHAGRSFYEELLEAGVSVHEYRPGMIHAKTMVVDGRIAFVGSANMDMRSFRLNFEVHALIHDEETARELENRFAQDLAESDRISLATWQTRPMHLRIAEGSARLVSPLL